MPTQNELNQIGIVEWSTIQARFHNPDLLLGNGFSLTFSGNFAYHSLFKKFLSNCSTQYQSLFNQFGTNNFEEILKFLKAALKVNTILGLQTQPIYAAIDELKRGLITTIQQVHPTYANINQARLSSIARNLSAFGDIYTTNYDLYLYHIIMITNDLKITLSNYVAYQDYFWGNQAPKGLLQFMNYQHYTYKHLYYLHGSLCVFRTRTMNVKLKKEGADELIERIEDEINKGHFPIFVSEEDGQKKKLTIENNSYLRFCLEKLEESDKPIVVFGNTLGDFDSHILEAIKSNRSDIIYCVYPGSRAIAEIDAERANFLAKLNGYTGQCHFVNSETVF